ncbi:CPBP family intramembrane metalloprotease [Massilia sp. CFBP 13647]|uniref:CPBP family glutamic-type intramembrane protease n=1 Tax=Massilia sp. CFBP 13721 TaxID=2775300 RepID=UPI0017854954|nr:CPBP family intramembrane metalloprotease [Massilia sp. CFBP 13647]
MVHKNNVNMNFAMIAKYLCWDDKSLVAGLWRSVGVGACTAALLSLLSALLFALMDLANIGGLAGTGIFEGGWIFTFFAAVIWAPLWETLIAQLVPISLFMRFGARPSIAVLGSAVLFSAGHVAYGGGIGQGLVTFVAGLLMASLFAANARPGPGRAFLFTGTAHAANNALVILLSFGLGF